MKLTVVIPAHNEEEVIGDTLEKLESELGVPHEVVVVNDHSTDRTAHAVKEAAKRWPNIRLVDNPLPGGFTNALKAGFSSVSRSPPRNGLPNSAATAPGIRCVSEG